MDTYYTLFLYLLIPIITSLCALGISNSNIKYENEICLRFLIFIVLFIPASIRYGIGTDYFSYQDIYINNYYGGDFEPAFSLILFLCNKFNCSFNFFLSIISIVTLLPISFILPQKGYFFYILFYNITFTYLQTFNGIRQYAAISYLIIACIKFMEKNKKQYIFYSVVSVLFHYSSILPILIIPLCVLKIGKKKSLFIIILLILFLIKFDIIEIIGNFLTVIKIPYAKYFLEYSRIKGANSGLGLLLYAVIPFFLIIKNDGSRKGIILSNLSIIYICLIILAGQLIFFSRMREAFVFVPILGIGYYFRNTKRDIKSISFLICLFSLLLTYITTIIKTDNVTPYTSLFFN